MVKKADFDTLAVRAGQERSQFNEHSEALYLTSSFVFDNAAQAAARFSGAEEGYVYGRFTNPTVDMFQRRLAALEGAEACIATSSGMSAQLSTVMALMSSGDHIVSSQSVFGATLNLFSTVFSRFGIGTTFVFLTFRFEHNPGALSTPRFHRSSQDFGGLPATAPPPPK